VNHVLSTGKAARQADLTLEERDLVKSLMLLTMKPVIYAANVADNDLATGNELSRKLVEYASDEGSIVVLVSAQVIENSCLHTPTHSYLKTLVILVVVV
jgi:ribosome-binding ATPase